MYDLDGPVESPALKKDNKSSNSGNNGASKKTVVNNFVENPPLKRKATLPSTGSGYKQRGYADKDKYGNHPPVMKSALPADLKFKSKL